MAFNYEAYRQANPDLASLSDAELLTQYASTGFAAKNLVSFDASEYLKANPWLVDGGITTETALAHYDNYGKAEFLKVAFDSANYLAANPFLDQSWTYDMALSHYNVYGSAENFLLHFDAQAYLDANPELVGAGITTATALSHFNTFGTDEHRLMSFDAEAYLQLNPELVTAGITTETATAHYLNFGQYEGRAYYHDFTYNQAINTVEAGQDASGQAGQAINLDGMNFIDVNNDTLQVTISDGGEGGTFTYTDYAGNTVTGANSITVLGTPSALVNATKGILGDLTYTAQAEDAGKDITVTFSASDQLSAVKTDTLTVSVQAGEYTRVDLVDGTTTTGTEGVAEAFYYDITTSNGRAVQANGTCGLTGFNASEDKLVFVDASSTITTATFESYDGVSILNNPFAQTGTIAFDPNASGVGGEITMNGFQFAANGALAPAQFEVQWA